MANELNNNEINQLCSDCRNECKQPASVAIISCPQKVKVDEQLTLFTKCGKPKKIKKAKERKRR